MKKYDNYKDSRVEWIGKIPTEWEIKKLKYCIDSNIGGFWGEEPKENENDIGCIRVSEFIKENGVLKNTELTKRNICKSKFNQIKVQKGSILIEKSGGGETCLVGNAVIVNDDLNAIYSNFITKIEVKNQYNSFFINYMLRCMYLKKINYLCINQTTGIQNLNVPKYLSTYIPIPSIKEQNEIVRYLDGKISNIDNLINKKEELIKTIKLSKQKIISEAVTKGLNEDIEMKDSGVEWIGPIPKYWNLTKIKYTTYVKGRIGWQGLKSDEFIDNGPYLVTGTDFDNGLINWESCYHIEEKRYNEAKPIQLKENDLLITKDGTIGKIALVKDKPDKASLNSGIFVTRPLDSEVYTNDFMYWILLSDSFKKYIAINETGSTIKHLYQETFVNFEYALPNIEEQKEIARYLNENISKIDNLINKIVEQIELLKKAKQKLITEVVTGKIDVRDL